MSLPSLFGALPRSGAYTVSAIAAVTSDGGSNWMAAEELEPLFGGSGSRPKNWEAAPYGGAVAFRGVAASAFRMLSGCTTGSRCFLDCQTPRR